MSAQPVPRKTRMIPRTKIIPHTKTIPHKPKAKPDPDHWDLRLYVAGLSPRSVAAFRNLQQLCEEHLAGRYHIEVIDLTKNPELAQTDQILAVPTLVRKLPSPIRKIIGTLSDTERVIVGLGLRLKAPNPFAAGEGVIHAG